MTNLKYHRRQNKHILFFLLISILFAFPLHLFSSTQVSLLTTMPCDKAVYTLWGHSALRVKTDTTDDVYNYGVFSFGDGFVCRFVRGETDYWVQRESMNMVFREVVLIKETYMTEQVLNLTEDEACAIHEALKTNALEENKYYRYNFFYDNCATRPRNLVEKVLGDLTYPVVNSEATYRDKVHEHTQGEPWLEFGIDLCLGSETDKVIKDYDLTFLPRELMLAYDNTNRVEGDSIFPLVRETKVLGELDSIGTEKLSVTSYPLFVFSVFALIVLLFTLWQIKRKNRNVLLDSLLFIVYGSVGILLFFLTFFSTHPCVNPNFNLLLLNPLQLLFPVLCFVKPLKRIFNGYLWVNLAMCLILLVGFPLIPQEFHLAVIPLSFIMVVRSLFLLIRNGGIKKVKF